MVPVKVNTLDRYEILGELGRGAISIVYDARDLLTHRPVALKLIEPSLWARPTSAAEPLRFLTEAMPEWRLRHPNIVRVYDAGASDGRLYVAMERLEGRTLRRVLDESPSPGLPRSLRIAAELASGLAHAHERGVVHRYLKPSNIFVFADDRAKITDLGMAPLRDAVLASPNHAACLSYMSPEEIRCDATIDGRSDIFSLGVVLYEMLTGERPFSGNSPDEIMRNVLEAEPPLPSEVNADVAPMVDLLVWSMLAKHRFDRAPSAEILARRLRRLGEEVEVALTAHARDEGMSAAETTVERTAGDRNVLMPGHRGDDRAPSAEILVDGELGEEVGGVLTAPARDEGMSAAGTTDERASGDRNVLMPDHRGDDRAPSAEILVDGELGAEVDGVLTAHARDEGMSGAGTTDERASGDRNVALMPDHPGDDRAPSAEILVHGERGEEVDGVLTAQARDGAVSAAAGTTEERASDDRNAVLTPGHRGATQRAKLRLPTYALTVLILAVAGSGFLWQWQQSLSSSEAGSAKPSEEPATATTFEPSIPGEPRLSTSAPEPKKAVSEPEPKKRASKAPASKPSRSAVASGSATEQEIEPPAVALATEPALAPPPPPAKTATLVLDVSPWGEIYVDGKLHGTTPPVKTVDLPPGRHRIELRNSAKPHYVIYTTLEPGDVRRIRHQFE